MVALTRSRTVLQKAASYVQKNYACLVREPNLFLMRKLARFEPFRQLHRLLSGAADILIANQDSLLGNIDADTIANQIRTEGCYPGLRLPADLVQSLLAFASTTPCYGDRNSNLPFYIVDRKALEARLDQPLVLASYMGSHETCPAFQQLRNDPGLLAIAERYLGAPPAYVASELMWSFPAPTTQFQQLKAAQVLHCDIDDYRCLKFFFYLTDVGLLSGPHIYLRKSHRNKTFLHQLLGERCASIPDQKLVETYGAENLTTFCGPAGYGFVEDIFGFHKGSPPQSQQRLLLQIEYATTYYKTLRICGK
jgi:hypothetical protein